MMRVAIHRPFTHAQRERLVEATARLRGEMRRVVSDVPIANRTVHGLASLWGIDRNLTQRLLAALSPARTDLEAFAVLPGTRGLAKIVEAVERVGGKRRKSSLTPLAAALMTYDEVVAELGRSHVAIVRELSRPTSEQPAGDASISRAEERSISSASPGREAEIAGCTFELDYGISGITTSRQFPGRWQNLVVSAYVGVRCLREGITLTLQRTVTGQSAGELLPDVTSRSLAELMDGREGALTRYGRGPTPAFSRRSTGGEDLECLDLPLTEQPLDIVVGAVRDNIDTTPTREGFCWGQGVRVRYPTTKLVFDHYVHRSLDHRWIANGSCYWWTPTLIAHPQTDWHERIPVPVRVERDESGRAAPELPEWHRATDLTRAVLEAVNWRHTDFVRYRVWVDQPVWGSMAYLSFLGGDDGHART